MSRARRRDVRPPARAWCNPVATGTLVVALAAAPGLLLVAVRTFRTLCAQYPSLALLTFRAPALPLVLAGIALLAGIGAGVSGVIGSQRFNRQLQSRAVPAPPRLLRIGIDLGIADRLTYLAQARPAACCYGMLHPRIAVTAALVARLDDEELTATLAHERHHLRRRDPLRYLVLHMLTAAAFLFPVVPGLRQRQEARIELAADRAALAVASRGALAGAMLAVLDAAPPRRSGAAWLSATEARIAHLGGRALVPGIPLRLVVASVCVAFVILGSTIHLAAAADLVMSMCAYCARAF